MVYENTGCNSCTKHYGGVLFVAALILGCALSIAVGIILGALRSAFIIGNLAAFAGFGVIMLILLVITIIIGANRTSVRTNN